MIYYYSDEQNDDFASMERKTLKIDDDYNYIHKNIIYKCCSFVVYRLIMTPIAFLSMKIKYHHKIKNKRVLKKLKKQGYFLYGNHTMYGADAFIPNLVSFPKKTMVIVDPCNLSTKGTKTFIEMSGALPIPSTLKGMKKFMDGIEYHIKKKRCIQIYPEAHVWPYCTFIRNFRSVSFKYPCKLNVPSFAFTNTFVKRKYSKNPKVITYVDGPFYPNKDLDIKDQQEDLRNRILKVMKERSKNSIYKINDFVFRGDLND